MIFPKGMEWSRGSRGKTRRLVLFIRVIVQRDIVAIGRRNQNFYCFEDDG